MSIDKVRSYFRELGMEDRVMEFEVSSATVELAAQALACEPCRIAKTLSFLAKDGSYVLSILKSLDGNPDCNKRFFYEYDNPQPGMGHFIHTYQANLDPLPSFEGEPRCVEVDGNAQELADMLWNHLNADNKVSLFVRTIDLKTGETETVIKNKHQ